MGPVHYAPDCLKAQVPNCDCKRKLDTTPCCWLTQPQDRENPSDVRQSAKMQKGHHSIVLAPFRRSSIVVQPVNGSYARQLVSLPTANASPGPICPSQGLYSSDCQCRTAGAVHDRHCLGLGLATPPLHCCALPPDPLAQGLISPSACCVFYI